MNIEVTILEVEIYFQRYFCQPRTFVITYQKVLSWISNSKGVYQSMYSLKGVKKFEMFLTFEDEYK